MTKLDKTFQKDQILTAGELNLLVKKINEIIDYINGSSQSNNNNNSGEDNTVPVDYYTTCEIKRTGPETAIITITLGEDLFNAFNGHTVRVNIEETTDMSVADDASIGWTLSGSRLVNVTSNKVEIAINRNEQKTKYRFIIEPTIGSNPRAVTNTIIIAKKGMNVIDDDAPLTLPE